MIRLLLSIALPCSLIITGCAALVVGTATGVGVYTYMNGVLTRTYQATFDRSGDACTAVLDSLAINVTEKTSSGIKTQITGQRRDGTPISVRVVMIEPRITEVSVRSGLVGVWDKKYSELIHASIAQRLQ